MNEHAEPGLIDSWRSRAEECREAAKRLSSVDARMRMLAAAEKFALMASQTRDQKPARWARP